MAKQYHHFTNAGIALYVNEGPNEPNAGPMLPTTERAPVKEVRISMFPRQPTKVVVITRNIYTTINAATLNTTSFLPGLLFSRIEKTPCGCSIFLVSLFTCLQRITQRTTLIPPDVEPEQPPIKNSIKIINCAVIGHVVKSVVAKPVVVIIAAT